MTTVPDFEFPLPTPTLPSAVPEITASTNSPLTPVLGEAYFFTCNVSISSDISPSFSYSLIRGAGGALTTVNTASLPMVQFSALTLADAGSYQCSVTISSPFLTNDITVTTEPPLVISLDRKLNHSMT